MRKRVEAALAKHYRGEPLTRKELLVVQWIRYGGGCSSCATSVPVTVRQNSKAG